MAELENLLLWTFISECAVPDDISTMLVDGETAQKAFKTIRDVAFLRIKD